MELSIAPNVGASIKNKQERLYTICHDYLIDNFHKFTEANKIKIATVLCGKMAPQHIEGNYNVTKLEKVKINGKSQELHIGNRIGQFAPCAGETAPTDN